MGGSGLAGNIVQAYVADKLTVPLVVCKGYTLPAFVGPDTLFIAISASGNTEETIAVVRQAMECGASLAFVTSGGELLRVAREHELPHVRLPEEPKQARALLGAVVTGLLYLLHYAGLLDDTFKTELRQSIELLEEQKSTLKVQASALASGLHKKLPLIYTSDALEPMALRLQEQLNTNAKQLAHVNVLPRMNHNEVEGWQHPEELSGHMAVVFIKTSYDHPRTLKRMELTRPLVERRVPDVLEVETVGATYLEQVFYLVHLFDWVSVYLAELNAADPNENENIDYLKVALAKE